MTHTEREKMLVTGGLGFIGANLVPLLSKKYEVTVIDNHSIGRHHEQVSRYARCIEADVRDTETIRDIVAEQDYIIHLAAYGSVVDSVKDPTVNFANNVEGTFSVLRLAALSGIKHFIFASTGGALIGNAVPPVNENSLPSPISPYGASKLCGEAYCHGIAGAYGLNTTILRFANIYGPYSEYKKGAVTAFMKAIHNGDIINIYGDGKASRDFLYVEDLCNAILTILQSPTEPGSIFHLAYGREVSVLELAKLICSTAGQPDHPFNFLPKRSGEIDRNFASYDKARKTFHFEPQVSLEKGLKRTWEWFRQNVFK